MASWFEDPKQLVRVDKVHEFWPSKSQTSADRVNASARFIIYASCIIYLIKRDHTHFCFRSNSTRSSLYNGKIGYG